MGEDPSLRNELTPRRKRSVGKLLLTSEWRCRARGSRDRTKKHGGGRGELDERKNKAGKKGEGGHAAQVISSGTAGVLLAGPITVGAEALTLNKDEGRPIWGSKAKCNNQDDDEFGNRNRARTE